jgi:WD40 repeat protein
VRGDLDWIVLKALEKDRARRYETASGLALDVARFLRHEPISARPPGTLYQFRKLVRRNKLVFASAAAVVMALIAGLGIATVALVKESRARQEANDRAEESRERLVDLHVTTGNKFAEDGYDFTALLWFVEALRLDEGDPARADIHRRRIREILHRTPRLNQLWTHDSFVRSAEFSPDGERVISVGWDGMAKVWNTHDGRPVLAPMRTGTQLENGIFTPDGKRILTMDIDGKVGLWNAATGEGLATLPTSAYWGALDVSRDSRQVLAGVPKGVQLFDTTDGKEIGPVIPFSSKVDFLVFSPDGRSAIAGETRTDASLLELPSGRVLHKLPGTHGLRRVCFSADGRRFLTMTWRDVGLWDTANGQLIRPVIQPGGDLHDCRFSPDERRFSVASWSGFARVYDAGTGLPVSLPMRHPNSVTCSAFSSDGRFVATVSRDGTARIWNAATGDPVSPPLPHAGIVLAGVFSPDTNHFLTGSLDFTVRLWELQSRPGPRLMLRHADPVLHVHYTPDGRKLITAGHDGSAYVWDAQNGERLAKLFADPIIVQSTALRADGKFLLTGTQQGVVRLWDINREHPLFTLEKLPAGISALAFSTDGKRFLVACGDRVRVWSSTNGEATGPWLTHPGEIRSAAFSPDGRRVVTAGVGSAVQVLDAETGFPAGPQFKLDSESAQAFFTHDGRRLITSRNDASEQPRPAQVWDAVSGQPVGSPMFHQDGVVCADISGDDRWIATCSDDDTATIWDARTGKPVAAPLPHRDDVGLVRLSPDGRLLLTASDDFTARIWDSATGEPITPPLLHDRVVAGAAWRPDGREVVTCSLDGMARVWDVSPAVEPVAQLRREAELLSAHRIEPGIGTVPLTAEEMKERWQERNEP